MKTTLLNLIALSFAALLAACSGEAPSSTVEKPSGPAPELAPANKPVKKGERYGSLKVNFGDEEVEVELFKKMGTELVPSGPGAGIRLAGPDDEVFSLNYTVNDGDSPTGRFVPISGTPPAEGERSAMLSIMGFLKSDPSITFKTGTITVTKCDAEGNFAATFEGKGASASDPSNTALIPLSGAVDVKIP
ncbi:MAG: hypothetical protein P1U86_17105 [Verrucomicrobiales bacterium]|nr:hypothetical protein [Verrucomicrobiales bacterium]